MIPQKVATVSDSNPVFAAEVRRLTLVARYLAPIRTQTWYWRGQHTNIFMAQIAKSKYAGNRPRERWLWVAENRPLESDPGSQHLKKKLSSASALP